MSTLETIEALVKDSFYRLERKFDQQAHESRCRDELIHEDVLKNREELAIQRIRIDAAEHYMQHAAEQSGAERADELKALRQSKAHWTRWGVGTAVGFVLALMAAGATMLLR